jgi:hypothetical protein
MDINTFDGDGFLTDTEVAQLLSKHPKSIARWDKNPKLKELGWPQPIYFNGRRHRSRPALREFLTNAADAMLNLVVFKQTPPVT